MPGTHEPLSEWKTAISTSQIQWIVCLAPLDEIQQKSPNYFQAIETNNLPCEYKVFEVPDFGVPEDRNGFLELARQVAGRLKLGHHILLHCAGGIGRTGTFAICVLLALGIEPQQACKTVKTAGSGPETKAQKQLITWVASHIDVR